jgi:hypothetical protein
VHDELDRAHPKGMNENQTSDFSSGAVEGVIWLPQDLPKNLENARLIVALTPISDDQTAVLAIAESQRSLTVPAFRLPQSVQRLRIVRVTDIEPGTSTRRAVRVDAAPLSDDINSLRAYPKNPGFTCGVNGAPHYLVEGKTSRHRWTVNVGGCRPAIIIKRDDFPSRLFHPTKAVEQAVRRAFRAADQVD